MKSITDTIPDLEEVGAKMERPSVQGGSAVDRYIAAAEEAAKAAAVMEELKPKLIAMGMEAVFGHNCANVPEKRVKSARLLGTGPQFTLMATCVDKSPKLDAKKVAAELSAVRTVGGRVPNPDRYTQYEIVAEFDASCFHDAKGRIDPENVQRISEALEATAKALGIVNPVKLAKKLVLTDFWWEDRFDRFNAATLVELCTSAIPQQVSLKKG